MPHAAETACLEELRRAGLPAQKHLARLLILLRGAPESHIDIPQAEHMAVEAGLAAAPGDLSRQMDILADHGLLGRLRGSMSGPVFDTVTEPHAHLIYEASAQIVDLHVSADTLLAILRQALSERPGGVEILIRAPSVDAKFPPRRADRANVADDADARFQPMARASLE
jgi:Fur family iron response transcriptional regulator